MVQIRSGKSPLQQSEGLDSVSFVGTLGSSYSQFNVIKCSNFMEVPTAHPPFLLIFSSYYLYGMTVFNLLFNIWFNVFAIRFTTCEVVCVILFKKRISRLCQLRYCNWLCLLCIKQFKMFDLFVKKRCWFFFDMSLLLTVSGSNVSFRVDEKKPSNFVMTFNF